eukprot:4711066-Alexandrium_andersonii.AAC.1
MAIARSQVQTWTPLLTDEARNSPLCSTARPRTTVHMASETCQAKSWQASSTEPPNTSVHLG